MGVALEMIAGVRAAFGAHETLIASLLAGFGVLLWLCGARFSRSILTLAGVGIGAAVGMHVPALMHWPIDGIATAFAGAMLLGLAGLLLQTTFIGFALSSLLAALAGAGAWAVFAGDATWTLPTIGRSMPQTAMLNAIWLSLPGAKLPQVMPYAVGAGAVIGAGITLLWPKLARVMTYGLLGTTFAAMGMILLQPNLEASMPMLPQTFGGRLGLFTVVAVIGMVIQWLMLPSARREPRPAAPTKAHAVHSMSAPASVSTRKMVAAGGLHA